jgi:hypothetical protein
MIVFREDKTINEHVVVRIFSSKEGHVFITSDTHTSGLSATLCVGDTKTAREIAAMLVAAADAADKANTKQEAK